MGMAVDANVLIYERMREEAQLGRSTINAIEAGFSRALATIVDSNLTTLIAAHRPLRARLRPDPRLRRDAGDRHHHAPCSPRIC